MLESILLMVGGFLFFLGTIGAIIFTIGLIALIRLWNQYNMSGKLRNLWTQLKRFISGRGFGF